MQTLIHERPIHFDIRRAWNLNVRSLQAKSRVRKAFQILQDRWFEVAELIREEMENVDPQRAREEFELNIHIGEVRIFSWHWVAQQFDALELAQPQLAICRELAPERQWEIVENDLHSVVTDSERTLVSDLRLGDRLSAAASLLYAGETEMARFLGVQQEVIAYLKASTEALQDSARLMENELKKMNRDADSTILRPREKKD